MGGFFLVSNLGVTIAQIGPRAANSCSPRRSDERRWGLRSRREDSQSCLLLVGQMSFPRSERQLTDFDRGRTIPVAQWHRLFPFVPFCFGGVPCRCSSSAEATQQKRNSQWFDSKVDFMDAMVMYRGNGFFGSTSRCTQIPHQLVGGYPSIHRASIYPNWFKNGLCPSRGSWLRPEVVGMLSVFDWSEMTMRKDKAWAGREWFVVRKAEVRMAQDNTLIPHVKMLGRFRLRAQGHKRERPSQQAGSFCGPLLED